VVARHRLHVFTSTREQILQPVKRMVSQQLQNVLLLRTDEIPETKVAYGNTLPFVDKNMHYARRIEIQQLQQQSAAIIKLCITHYKGNHHKYNGLEHIQPVRLSSALRPASKLASKY